MSLTESLIHDIKTLPASKLVELRRALDRISPETAIERKREREQILAGAAGVFSGEAGDDFESAISDLGRQGLDE